MAARHCVRGSCVGAGVIASVLDTTLRDTDAASARELQQHLHAFLLAYNCAQRLKTLKGKTTFAHEPDLIARHELHSIIEHTVLMAVRHTDMVGREETCQPPFSAPPPFAQ